MTAKKQEDRFPLLVTVESKRPENFTQLTNLIDRIADLHAAAGHDSHDKLAVDLGSPTGEIVMFNWIV